MGQATTLILLPQTSFTGTNNQVIGSRTAASGYYQNFLNQQTFTWNLTSVTGLITIQGSIVDEPASNSDWFALYLLSCTNLTQISYTTIPANLVWVRARIDGFSNGVVQNIKVSY